MAEPTLYARMELRLNDFEKKLAKATKSTDQTMRKIEARGDQMTARMRGMGAGAFGGLIKGAALALAPILSVGAALNVAKTALSEFGDIADNARSAGLDVEFFQGIANGAELAGVEFSAFSSALNTFAKNSGLAAEGKGRMVTALKALNPELLANITAATNQEQRLRLAADAIEATSDASQRAALATALFGDAGFKLADALSQGSSGIDRTVASARELGLVIDRSLIARAEEMGDEFEIASKVMNLQFQQALVDLAPILVSTAQLAGGLASAINFITESMQNLSQRGTARLEADLADIDSQLSAANVEYAPGVVTQMGVEIDPAGQAALQAQRDEIMKELRRRAVDQLRIDLSRPKPTDSGGGDSGDGDAAAKAAIKHAEAVKALIADLQFERDTLHETSLEQQILNTLRNAGVDAASAEGMAIRGLITELESQKSAIDANADAMKAFGDATANALGTFIDDMIEGKSLADSFSGILKNMGSQLISAGLSSLTGSSGLGSLFSGIPGRATGGPVQAGQPYIVGEKRPELFVPNTSGRIVPRVPMPGPVPRGSGGGRFSAPVNITIDATGADAAGLARVEQRLVGLRAELPGLIKQTVGRRAKDIW